MCIVLSRLSSRRRRRRTASGRNRNHAACLLLTLRRAGLSGILNNYALKVVITTLQLPAGCTAYVKLYSQETRFYTPRDE